MPAARLGSILLSSTDPDRLGAWYADMFQPDTDERMDVYRVLGFDGFWLMIDRRSDVGDRAPEPARLILNFDTEDAAPILARMESAGVTWVAPPEDREGSTFATAEDPDGNWVQVVQVSEEERARMADAG